MTDDKRLPTARELAQQGNSADRCPTCGCKDRREFLGADGRRFVGCRFCFRPMRGKSHATATK